MAHLVMIDLLILLEELQLILAMLLDVLGDHVRHDLKSSLGRLFLELSFLTWAVDAQIDVEILLSQVLLLRQLHPV